MPPAALSWVLLAAVVLLSISTFLLWLSLLSVRRGQREITELLQGTEITPRLNRAMFEFFATPMHRRVLIDEIKTALKQQDAADAAAAAAAGTTSGLDRPDPGKGP